MLVLTNTSCARAAASAPRSLHALGHAHGVDGSLMSSISITNSSPPKRASVLAPPSASAPASRRHGVVVPHHARQPLREREQQLVAHGVSEAVVDVLEAIEVDEEHREVVLGCRTRRAIARSSRSMNSTRLGSRVSGSWIASWISRWCATRRLALISLNACATVTSSALPRTAAAARGCRRRCRRPPPRCRAAAG